MNLFVDLERKPAQACEVGSDSPVHSETLRLFEVRFSLQPIGLNAKFGTGHGLIVSFDKAVDGGLQIEDGSKHAVL